MKDHRDHLGHTIVPSDQFSTKQSFIQMAQKHGKCVTDNNGRVLTLETPLTAPMNLGAQVSDSQISVSSNVPINTGVARKTFDSNFRDFRNEVTAQADSVRSHLATGGNRPSSSAGPQMMP
jgi:hypothetical protein